MTYCKNCERMVANCLDMVDMGLMPDSADSREEQAEMMAYDQGLTCASRGKECEVEED